MFDHLGRWLLIIVGTLALLHGASQSGLAQVDVDRELARARNEWMEGTPAARVKTLVRLESLGEDASPAVPILVAALHETDPSTRVKAAQVLGQVGFRARAAIPELTTLLKDPEPGVRVSAVKALATFDRKAEPSIPALVQSLRAGPDLRCPEAVTVLAAIGDPALPAIADFLKDPDPEIRKTAIRCLAQLPSWHSSGRPGAIAVNLQPRVNALARDPDTGVRIALTQMLAGTMRDSEEAAETLRILFRDPAAEVRLAVVTAMSQQGIVPKIFVPLLLELCKDGDRRVRIAAVGTLPQADVTSATVIDRLLDALRDPDADIRAETAEKLALAYSDGEEMWSTVGREFYVPTSVRKALARTAPARASLKSALADPDCRVRAATASLLPAFQDEAATIVPMLTDRLKDPVASVRAASAAALARFGPAARGATRPLLAMLSHPARFSDGGYLVSTSAAKALVAIGDEAKAKMLRVLLAQLNSLDEPTRKRAAEVLVAVGGKITWDMLHTMAVARTTRCVQVEVLDILSRTIAGHPPRSEVRAIVPVLKTLARDDDAEVRLSALGLLIDIDPVAADIPSRYFAYLRDGQDPNLDEQWFSTTARPAMIPQWIQGLNDQDPKIRVATVTILAVMAEPWAQAPDRRLKIEIVRALVSTLKDTDTRVRWIAAETLGVLKLEAKTVIPALIGMVNTESKPIPADDRITIRSFADRDQPCCLGPRKKGDDTPRVAAIQALGSYGEEAASAVPELVRALRDRDLRVRWFAAEALALIGPEAKDSVPALIEALRSRDVADGAGDLGGVRHEGDGMEDGPIRLMAAVALGKIGTEEAKAAVPDLIKALSGPDSRVRGAAVRALISIGAEPGGMIPELVRLVTQRPVAEVAEEAQDYLVLIGEAAVPPLIEVFRDRDPDARLAAINVLAQIGTTGAGAIPEIIACLDDREIELRVAAAGALGGIARETVAVIPALIAALKDPEEDVSYAACESLNIIGKPALPAVLSLLRDADPVVRERASGALSYMGSSSLGASEELARERRDATRTALRSVLGDRDERVRSGASEAIKSLLPDAVPVLVSALEDPSPAIRIGAARTLGAIGNDARDALGQLRRLQNDPDPGVREAVDAAIRAITNSDPAKP